MHLKYYTFCGCRYLLNHCTFYIFHRAGFQAGARTMFAMGTVGALSGNSSQRSKSGMLTHLVKLGILVPPNIHFYYFIY